MDFVKKFFSNALLIRFALTPLLYFTRNSIPYTVLLLIFMDLIDCNPIITQTLSKKELEEINYCHKDHTHVVHDKLMSIFQYCIGIYFLSPMLPKEVLVIVVSFTIMRLFGVFYHAKTQNKDYFVLFFDFVKEYLILFYIYYPKLTISVLVEAMGIKILLEYVLHKTAAMSTFMQLLVSTTY